MSLRRRRGKGPAQAGADVNFAPTESRPAGDSASSTRVAALAAAVASAVPSRRKDEFVAGQAGQGVLADDAAQAARHVNEDGIARAMAQAVVDQLETVEVDEAQGKAPTVSPRAKTSRRRWSKRTRLGSPVSASVVGAVGELAFRPTSAVTSLMTPT